MRLDQLLHSCEEVSSRTESEADDSDGLEDPSVYDCEPLRWVAFQLFRNVRALDEDGDDDDAHAKEGEARSPR